MSFNLLVVDLSDQCRKTVGAYPCFSVDNYQSVAFGYSFNMYMHHLTNVVLFC